MQYYDKIPLFLNNCMTKDNTEIIMTSLTLLAKNFITLKDIKEALLIFTLKELEHLATGLPFD